jgi:predicted small lipoprotein YifL
LGRTLPVAVVIAATLACGKKGPLLPPYVRQPAAAEITDARRVGDDVYVTIAVPTADIDGATPASLATIEVWAVTARTPPPARAIPRDATLVITIPVAQDAEPGDRSGTVVPDPATGALQGTTITVRDTLTSEELAPQEAPAVGEKPTRAEDLAATPVPLQRFYVTVPRSARKKVGLLSAVKEVPLTFVPDKVPAVRVAMSGHDVVVQWEPSGGILGWLLERPLAPEVPLATPTPPAPSPPPPVPGAVSPAEPAAAASTSPTAGQTLYNIYRDVAPDPLALTTAGDAPRPWAVTPAAPINPQPVADLMFADAEVPFDERERCYYVRAVRGSGAWQVESEPSDRTAASCIVPVDTVPPVAPTGLSATALDGEVQLRWEPNGEEDLRGYIVLRSEAGDDTLVELTRDGPRTETRFTDDTVVAGRTYTYVVQAVDTRTPLPNVSERATETVTAR